MPQPGQGSRVGPSAESGLSGLTTGLVVSVASESVEFGCRAGVWVLVSGVGYCESQAVLTVTVVAMKMAWSSFGEIFMGFWNGAQP